jgi:hypothetical protein
MPQRLLATALFISAAAVVPTAGCSSAPASPDQSAASVATKLRSVSAVEFYFLSRTEEWNYTPGEFAAKSTIRAYRACGGNCHNFMRPVLDHLRAARPIKCMPGMEDGLIRARPGVELIYSFSGRQIRIADSCYFNETGIRKVVSGGSMLFASSLALPVTGASANNSFKPNPLRGSA